MLRRASSHLARTVPFSFHMLLIFKLNALLFMVFVTSNLANSLHHFERLQLGQRDLFSERTCQTSPAFPYNWLTTDDRMDAMLVLDVPSPEGPHAYPLCGAG